MLPLLDTCLRQTIVDNLFFTTTSNIISFSSSAPLFPPPPLIELRWDLLKKIINFHAKNSKNKVKPSKAASGADNKEVGRADDAGGCGFIVVIVASRMLKPPRLHSCRLVVAAVRCPCTRTRVRKTSVRKCRRYLGGK